MQRSKNLNYHQICPGGPPQLRNQNHVCHRDTIHGMILERKLARTDAASLLCPSAWFGYDVFSQHAFLKTQATAKPRRSTKSPQCIDTGTKSPFANRNTFWSTTHVNSLTRNHVLWHPPTNTESRNHQEAPKQDYMELRHFTYWTSTNGDAENFWQGRRPARGRIQLCFLCIPLVKSYFLVLTLLEFSKEIQRKHSWKTLK